MELTVIVLGSFWQTCGAVGEVNTLTLGFGLTVTDVVYTVPGLHPEPEVLTVNEYTVVPVTVGTAVGLAAVVDDRPAPLHV